MGGCHPGEWKQITESDEWVGKSRSKHSRAVTASTVKRNNRPNERLTVPGHQSCSSYQPKKQRVWSRPEVNRRQLSGALVGAGMVDVALISATHYKETQALLQTPPCWHSQSFSTTACPALPHCLTVKNCWSGKEKRLQELYSRHFSNISDSGQLHLEINHLRLFDEAVSLKINSLFEFLCANLLSCFCHHQAELQ